MTAGALKTFDCSRSVVISCILTKFQFTFSVTHRKTECILEYNLSVECISSLIKTFTKTIFCQF